VEYRYGLGQTLNNLGINLWVRKQEDESKEVLRQAIASTSLLLKQNPGVATYRRLLNNHVGLLAEIEWRQGHAEASVERVRERLALWDEQPGEFFTGGCEFARVAAMGTVTAEQRRNWNGEALAALRKAVTLGFADARRLREHPDLAGLKQTPEFVRLVAEVEERKPPR
jgi:hypothetical protein